MQDNFNDIMGWIGLSEGGYVNHPRDPGGATDRGITQRVFSAWLRNKGMRDRPVRGISKSDAEEIIASQYFEPLRFDRLPSGVDYAVVDYGVNSGIYRAAKELQRVVGARPDGVIGEITLAKLAEHSPEHVVIELCNRRMRFVRGLKTFDTFGRGWTRRIMGERDGAQVGDIGVIDRGVRLARQETNIPAPTFTPDGATKAEDDTDSLSDSGVIRRVQSRLKALGYHEVGTVDGVWGTRTAGAVLAFRNDNGLALEARLDQELLLALWTAEPRYVDPDRANATVEDLRRQGSTDVQRNTSASHIGKVAVGVGGAATVATETGIFEKLGENAGLVDKAFGWLHQAGEVASDNASIFLVLMGAAVVYLAWDSNRNRVKRHRSGEYLSR